MKTIYFYDVNSKLMTAGSFNVQDDWQPVIGATDKVPDVSKRVRYIIKWDGDNWTYEKRNSLLWCHITDTPEHRERKSYYDCAIHYYNVIKQDNDVDGNYKTDLNPSDLLQYLKDNETMDIDESAFRYTLKDVIKWIDNYESTKSLNIM